MNWAQLKDLVSHMCIAGAVVTSWSLTQEVAGSSIFTVMTNILSLNSHLGKTPIGPCTIHKANLPSLVKILE